MTHRRASLPQNSAPQNPPGPKPTQRRYAFILMAPSALIARTVYVSGPIVIIVYQFPCAGAVSEFREEVSKMHSVVVELNRNVGRKTLSKDEIVSGLMTFYDLLGSFQDKFGSSVIPPDILYCAKKNNNVLSACGRATVLVPKDRSTLQSPPRWHCCCVVACGGCARYEKQKHDYDAGEGDRNNITHGFALWLALRRNHIDHPGWST